MNPKKNPPGGAATDGQGQGEHLNKSNRKSIAAQGEEVKATDAPSFLEHFFPDLAFMLIAIIPDGRTYAQRVNPGEIHTVAKTFLDKHASDKNIYFKCNPIKAGVDQNTVKLDHHSFRVIQVDIDPNKGEQKEEILERAQNHQPPFSCLVDSGNGVQGFYILKDPIFIKGNNDDERLKHIKELEQYNKGLCRAVGGDMKTTDISRMMRMPFTTNFPNKTKRGRGCVEVPTDLIYFSDKTYTREELSHLLTVQSSTTDRGSNIDFSKLPKKVDLSKLKIPVFTKQVILHGDDPDDPTRWNGDRSDAVFHVACDLVRHKIKPKVIAAILLEKSFPISAHIYDQQKPDGYVEKQINRANEKVAEERKASEVERERLLKEMNENHALVNYSGKTRVLDLRYADSKKRKDIQLSTCEDFRQMYANRQVLDEDGKLKPLGKWWIEHPNRRTYEGGIVFDPRGKVEDNEFNMWRGLGVEPKKGDWSLMKTHIEEIICDGNKEHSEYLLKWMAHAVQRPWEQAEVSVVLRGSKGTGKGKGFAETFAELFGRHKFHVANAKHLTGNFNGYQQETILLFADEAIWAGDKGAEGVLKMLITADEIPIERKGVDVIMAKNHLHLILASNHDWIVPASSPDEERRFFCS